jgi:hypothetical protein
MTVPVPTFGSETWASATKGKRKLESVFLRSVTRTPLLENKRNNIRNELVVFCIDEKIEYINNR